MKLNEWAANLDGKVEAEVEKFLGRKPTLPDGSAIVALMGKLVTNGKQYTKSRDKMDGDAKDSLAAYDKAIAELKKVAGQFKKENFGLDPKDKAQLKKIVDARAIYTDELEAMSKQFEKRKDKAKGWGKDKPPGDQASSMSPETLT